MLKDLFIIFSIVVFLGSIVYMIIKFLYESKFIKIMKDIQKGKKGSTCLEETVPVQLIFDEELLQEEKDEEQTPEDINTSDNSKKELSYNYYINNFKDCVNSIISKEVILFLKITFIVISTRILLYIFAYYSKMLISGDDLNFASIWIKWDAQHYLKIAKDWYIGGGVRDQEIFIVFYPLYPLLIRTLNVFIGDIFISSMILSNIFLIFGCYYMYKLFTLEYNAKIAVNGMKYLLFFPVAFFLSAPFSESLFLMLSVMMFYYLRKEEWLLSATFGLLAGISRFHGIILIIPFIIEYFIKCDVFMNIYKKDYRVLISDFFKKGIFVSLIPMGLGLYLILNKTVTGDWFKFLYWQKEHWYNSFKPFFEGSIPALIDQALSKGGDKTYLASMIMPEIIIILVAFITILFAMKYKMRVSYFAYMSVYIFFTISQSFLISAPRYILPVFPIYIVAAMLTSKNKKMDIVLTFASLLFLMYCLFAYVNGKQIM